MEYDKEGRRWHQNVPAGDCKTAVVSHQGFYWFFDETWSEAFGPYAIYEEALDACREYAKTL
jgi:hypothetical protein